MFLFNTSIIFYIQGGFCSAIYVVLPSYSLAASTHTVCMVSWSLSVSFRSWKKYLYVLDHYVFNVFINIFKTKISDQYTCSSLHLFFPPVLIPHFFSSLLADLLPSLSGFCLSLPVFILLYPYFPFSEPSPCLISSFSSSSALSLLVVYSVLSPRMFSFIVLGNMPHFQWIDLQPQYKVSGDILCYYISQLALWLVAVI